MKQTLATGKRIFAIVIVCVLLFSTLMCNASAAFVEYQYSSSDSNGGWKATEWRDTSSANQLVYAYTDCWKKSNGTRYHEHIMMITEGKNINRLTVTVEPVYYTTGKNIGSKRRYDTYNGTRLRVLPQAISSGGSKVTLFATLESQYTTATYTYHNIYGV